MRDSERLEEARAAFGVGVRVTEPFPGSPPLWIEPEAEVLRTSIGLAARWMKRHRDTIDQSLLTFGAIVLRGFPVSDSDDFVRLMKDFEPFSHRYFGSGADRKAISGRVMEATRMAPYVRIPLHQEFPYMPHSPRLLAFFCRQPSETGGETVICDMRGLLEELPAALRKKISELDIEYVRNCISEDADDWRAHPMINHPSWQYWFETNDRDQVEARLRYQDAEFEWHDDGSLTFWTRAPGTTVHPVTGDLLCHNQLNTQVLNAVTIGAERAAMLDKAYGASTPRPYGVRFANGEKLQDEEFMDFHTTIEKRKIAFPWRAGDVMLVENKLTAHGRHPFTGKRDVQVMMFD